jgi:hypothetical protein
MATLADGERVRVVRCEPSSRGADGNGTQGPRCRRAPRERQS